MALAQTGQIYLVTLGSTYANQQFMNTFKYVLNEPESGLTVDQACQALYTAIGPDEDTLVDCWLDCLSEELTHNFTRIQCIAPTRYAMSEFAAGTPGTQSTVQGATNTAAVITRRGELANRKNVGAIHVPIAAASSVIDNGVLSGGIKTLLQLLANEMLETYTLSGYTSGTMSPVLYTQPDSGQGQYYPVVETTVQSTARVMRRRTVGLGI